MRDRHRSRERSIEASAKIHEGRLKYARRSVRQIIAEWHVEDVGRETSNEFVLEWLKKIGHRLRELPSHMQHAESRNLFGHSCNLVLVVEWFIA